MGMWGDAPEKEEESEEEESSEEESEEENKQEMTREERRAAAKAKKEAAIKKKKGVPQVGDMPSSSEEESSEEEDDMPANPNHSKASRNQAAAPPRSVEEVEEGVKKMNVGGAKKPADMSRKEREALAAQQAKERYQKLHLEGKTDEAKADMARLKEIRAKREAEAARKQVCYAASELVRGQQLTSMFRPRRRSVRSRRRPTRHRSRPVRPSFVKLLLAHSPRRRAPRSKATATVTLYILGLASVCLRVSFWIYELLHLCIAARLHRIRDFESDFNIRTSYELSIMLPVSLVFCLSTTSDEINDSRRDLETRVGQPNSVPANAYILHY